MLGADILSAVEEVIKEGRKREELAEEQTKILRGIVSGLRHLENRFQ